MEELSELKSQLRILDAVDELADNDPSKFFEAWMEIRLELIQKIREKQKEET